MSLYDDLIKASGSPIVERVIDINGTQTVIYLRKFSANDAEDFFSVVEKDPKKNKRLRNKLLVKVLCNQDGTPALTFEQAGEIDNGLANKLQDAALEVNGLNKAAQDEAKKE